MFVRSRATMIPFGRCRAGMLRVIDESGEDYLYPKKWFADIRLPPALAKALAVRHNAH